MYGFLGGSLRKEGSLSSSLVKYAPSFALGPAVVTVITGGSPVSPSLFPSVSCWVELCVSLNSLVKKINNSKINSL